MGQTHAKYGSKISRRYWDETWVRKGDLVKCEGIWFIVMAQAGYDELKGIQISDGVSITCPMEEPVVNYETISRFYTYHCRPVFRCDVSGDWEAYVDWFRQLADKIKKTYTELQEKKAQEALQKTVAIKPNHKKHRHHKTKKREFAYKEKDIENDV
jgi:hypothetical protein